jgi:hypothetical protein
MPQNATVGNNEGIMEGSKVVIVLKLSDMLHFTAWYIPQLALGTLE